MHYVNIMCIYTYIIHKYIILLLSVRHTTKFEFYLSKVFKIILSENW